MTSNAFAALQGLKDAQMPRVAAASKPKKAAAAAAAATPVTAATAAAASAASRGEPSSAPAAAAAAPAAAAAEGEDDDGFTAVVASRGKRAPPAAAAAAKPEAKAPPAPAAAKDAAASTATATATATATVAATAAAAAKKKIGKDSRSASKTWADEIEEEEGGGPAGNGNGASSSSGGSKAADADAADADADSGAADADGGAAAAGPTKFLKDPLVWVDLEMTGLDVRADTIIEIAVMVSDGQLARVIEGPAIAIHHPDSVLDTMNAWSLEQHAKSGLTQRCRDSRTSLAEAEAQVLAFVRRHCDYQAGLFAGNSVHVDRAFLVAHMPALAGHLHYRIVDVSSVAELARRWHPKVWRAAPRKKKAHTAMADVRESLAELRYYRERLFNKRG